MQIKPMTNQLADPRYAYLTVENPFARTEKKPRLFMVAVLAAAFSASLAGGVLARIIDRDGLGNYIVAAMMVFLIVVAMFQPKQIKLKQMSTPHLVGLAAVLVFAFIQGVYWYGSGQIHSDARSSLINKTGGLILTCVALFSAVQVFRRKEITQALFWFAIIELALVLFSYFSSTIEGEFNLNNLGMRMAIAALVLFAVTENRILRIVFLVLPLLFVFSMQCRTSFVATCGALTALTFEKYSRKNRLLAILGAISGLILLFVALPTIHEILTELAISSLGSDNFLSHFLLSDKSVGDVRDNFLDRSHVWEHSWAHAREALVFGHGIGAEGAVLGGIRSHNAYLSIIIEGGLVFLGCWLLFYFPFLVKLLDRKWVEQDAQQGLNAAAVLILCYMLLSGIMESSGLGSIASPSNVIFIFLALFLSAENTQPAGRSK